MIPFVVVVEREDIHYFVISQNLHYIGEIYTCVIIHYDCKLCSATDRVLPLNESSEEESGFSEVGPGSSDVEAAKLGTNTLSGGIESFGVGDRKSTRLNSSHPSISRMPSSA